MNFQAQSTRRKIIYTTLILVLFTLSVALRKKFIEHRAIELSLKEESLGKVDLMSSALQLSLFGARGIVVCAMWNWAIEKQRKHEWNELEMIVRSLTKLQPHYITPWQFQSWNLAYNVSVESDRPADKYFYVTRGAELLAEGERRNQNNSQLRHEVGWIYQNKIGLADEKTTFRCLFQMSCMDPRDRHPRRFRQGRHDAIDMKVFEQFCKDHPTLVRRLREESREREPVLCSTPKDVVNFLEDNYRVPSRYLDRPDEKSLEEPTQLKDPEKRFPVLPPTQPKRFKWRCEEYTNDADLTDAFDNFLAARSWYSYSMDPLMDPDLESTVRVKMARVIFKGYPARAQAHYAETLQKAGWFDEDGWDVEQAQPREWFKTTFKAGDFKPWSREAWEFAYDLYKAHGEREGMILEKAEDEAGLTEQQRKNLEYNRRVTNFMHFYYKTSVEKEDAAVKARKMFFLADKYRKLGEPRRAVEYYENDAAFGPPAKWFLRDDDNQPVAIGWKRLFLEHPDFRADLENQQETYEYQLKYLTQKREEIRINVLKRLGLAGVMVPYNPLGLNGMMLPLQGDLDPGLRGPFDDSDKNGELITDVARQRVHGRLDTTPEASIKLPGKGRR